MQELFNNFINRLDYLEPIATFITVACTIWTLIFINHTETTKNNVRAFKMKIEERFTFNELVLLKKEINDVIVIVNKKNGHSNNLDTVGGGSKTLEKKLNQLLSKIRSNKLYEENIEIKQAVTECENIIDNTSYESMKKISHNLSDIIRNINKEINKK